MLTPHQINKIVRHGDTRIKSLTSLTPLTSPVLRTTMSSAGLQSSTTTEDTKPAPGRPSNFRGTRAIFLAGYHERWRIAREEKTTGDFWFGLYSEYWRIYSWRHGLDQEPTAAIDPNEVLSPDEEIQKAAVVKEVQNVSDLESLL